MFIVSLGDGRFDCGRTRIMQSSIYIQHDYDNGLQFYNVNEVSIAETTSTG